MKDELGGKIMVEFAALRPQIYDNKNKKVKGTEKTKKCVIKRKLKLEDYKSCLKTNQVENKITNKKINLIQIA